MKGIIFILFIALPQLSFSQTGESGIYLTVTCSRYDNYGNTYDPVLTSKKVCLANKPLITLKDFESISPLNDSNLAQIYFDIKISTDAAEVLDKLIKKFPNPEMALVIDHQVFIVFRLSEEQLNRTFRFRGKPGELSDFIAMNKKLLKMKKDGDF